MDTVLFVAVIVAVFAIGIGIQIAFDRRFAARSSRHDPKSQAHGQTVRGHLGAPGSQGPQR